MLAPAVNLRCTGGREHTGTYVVQLMAMLGAWIITRALKPLANPLRPSSANTWEGGWGGHNAARQQHTTRDVQGAAPWGQGWDGKSGLRDGTGREGGRMDTGLAEGMTTTTDDRRPATTQQENSPHPTPPHKDHCNHHYG